MRASEFITERKKRKRRPRWAAYGPGPYGGYGYYAGYSGDSGSEGGDGGGVGEDAMRGVIYTKPDLENEWLEANRYPEFQKLGKDQWIKISRQGSVAKWSSLKDVGNVDNDLSNLEPEKRKRAAVLVNRGKVELPIVGRWPDGYLDLIAGNTRIATLLDQGHDPKVWVVDVPDVDIKENFADGKNPQDKGDSKRHGVNTKASVSSLRKTAKQGGRKGQLAHWLANMKAGRAKKNK